MMQARITKSSCTDSLKILILCIISLPINSKGLYRAKALNESGIAGKEATDAFGSNIEHVFTNICYCSGNVTSLDSSS